MSLQRGLTVKRALLALLVVGQEDEADITSIFFAKKIKSSSFRSEIKIIVCCIATTQKKALTPTKCSHPILYCCSQAAQMREPIQLPIPLPKFPSVPDPSSGDRSASSLTRIIEEGEGIPTERKPPPSPFRPRGGHCSVQRIEDKGWAGREPPLTSLALDNSLLSLGVFCLPTTMHRKVCVELFHLFLTVRADINCIFYT